MHKTILFAMAAGAGAMFALPALAADARGEIMTAATHADLAAQASDLDGVHTHLHHTVNCLVGPGGAGFDKTQLNPCVNSGNGAIPDTTDAAKKKSLEAALAKANAGIATTDVKAAQADATATAAALRAIK